MVPIDTPLAKVLAVVGKDAVNVLSDPRSCATRRLLPGELGTQMGFDGIAFTTSELFKGPLFNGASIQSIRQTRIMNNVSVPNVDTMMRVTHARGDKMCANWD